MSVKTYSIKSILGGISDSQYYNTETQFQGSIGIDPDYPISTTSIKTSGVIVPTRYEKFSGANVNSPVVAIITESKDTKTYVILRNGRLISYDSSLGSETLIGTVAGGVANGGAYYNNYIYIPTGTDVSRYGPLDGVAALTDNVWTGATLGSQTALVNTTYPAFRNVTLPNHWMFQHQDGALYFCDYKNGQGQLHKIITKKVTNEGDTNNGSSYAVLKLPFGYLPTCITNYSTDMVISAIQTTDTTVNQGPAALFLWDSISASFYRGPVPIFDPFITAMLNKNGDVYVWSGNSSSGIRMSKYSGGEGVDNLTFQEEGVAPFQGAVSSFSGRVVWGSYTTFPISTASVFSYYSKNKKLSMGLHNVANTTSTGTNQIVTAVKYVQQADNIIPQMIIAWNDGSATGIDKRSTTATFTSVWRSPIINLGHQFEILRIRFPLGATVAANMTITPTLYTDDGNASTTLTAINNTNKSGQRHYLYLASEPTSPITGNNNFYMDLTWSSTALLPVMLPIEFDVNVHEDETYGVM